MVSIDPKKTANELVSFIKTTFEKAGFSKAVIGISGGVDSATSFELSVRALGKESVLSYFLPYQKIRSIVDEFFSFDPSMDKLRKGNVMARVRMTILFDQAKKHRALVVGTENKTEHILGYYTRFGDEASDIEPLRNLYKTQVYILAKYLGISKTILQKPPTAELWEGQTDEGEFGFTYKDADEVLYQLYDLKKDKVEGVDPNIVKKIKARIDRNAFKSLPSLVPEVGRG